MKKRIFVFAIGIATASFMMSCGGGAKKEAPAAEAAEAKTEVQEVAAPNTLTEAEKKDG